MSIVFNKSVQPEVLRLAEDVLNAETLEMANKLTDLLLGSEKERKHAIFHLQELIGTSPKRPVYYLNHEIIGLPEQTRHVVRFAGDYIDQMIKYCSYDKGDFLFFRSRGLHRSLGVNLRKLVKVLPQELISILTRFNEVIYVPSKHEWDVKDRPHLFSAKEAVYVCFMVKKLATQIAPFSKVVQTYEANEMYDYFYDSTQGAD